MRQKDQRRRLLRQQEKTVRQQARAARAQRRLLRDRQTPEPPGDHQPQDGQQ